MPQRFKLSIITLITRTYPGTDIGNLILCNLKLKLCIQKRTTTNIKIFDLNKHENATSTNT